MKHGVFILMFIMTTGVTLFCETDIAAIVRRADSLLRTEKVYSVSEMTVYRAGKPEPTMKVEGYALTRDTVVSSLTIYMAPAKMKGTAYLMIGDDIWIRFGNTGRIRKLSSSAKKNSAGGTDFSYNDMNENSNGLSEKYAIRLLEERVKADNEDCYKVQFTALPGTDAPYEKLIVYITREDARYVEVEYFENNAHIKTLTLSDWRETGGRLYPYLVTMESHTRPTYTEYRIVSIEFDSQLVKEHFFTQTYLKQIR
jgi:hypothetical protein